MHCQRLVLVGDAHLGRGTPDSERALLGFLDAVPSLGDGLVVTGDLFEFWFSYHRAVPRRNARVMAALAALRRRMPVLMVGGNHDRWGGTFWQDELGIEFHPHEARFEVGGRPALVVHGDGVTETDRAARLLHRVTSHPATIALFGAVHPDLGMWLVDRLSSVLGNRELGTEAIAAAAARQRAWAEARLAAEPELSLLVMGHTHRPVFVEVAPGRFYVNPGAWFDGNRFAAAGDGKVSLQQFQASA